MRTNVVFRYPAEFVALSLDDGVLSTNGAEWFVKLLKQVNGLIVDERLCQEDWGVAVFAQRHSRKFWIGLSAWSDDQWLAHFHHGSWAWLQKFSPSGTKELQELLIDFHRMLKTEPSVSDVIWHQEDQMSKPSPDSFSSPVDD
jgi:hypothetical protein